MYSNYQFYYLFQDAGHQFIVNGERHSLRGTIAFISGDNLGSQLIGGFKEGAGARLKCRHCMGSTPDIRTKVSLKILLQNVRSALHV